MCETSSSDSCLTRQSVSAHRLHWPHSLHPSQSVWRRRWWCYSSCLSLIVLHQSPCSHLQTSISQAANPTWWDQRLSPFFNILWQYAYIHITIVGDALYSGFCSVLYRCFDKAWIQGQERVFVIAVCNQICRAWKSIQILDSIVTWGMWSGIVLSLPECKLNLLMQSFESKMDLIKDSCLSLKLLGSKIARLLFPRNDPWLKLVSLTICSSSTIICVWAACHTYGHPLHSVR